MSFFEGVPRRLGLLEDFNPKEGLEAATILGFSFGRESRGALFETASE